MAKSSLWLLNRSNGEGFALHRRAAGMLPSVPVTILWEAVRVHRYQEPGRDLLRSRWKWDPNNSLAPHRNKYNQSQVRDYVWGGAEWEKANLFKSWHGPIWMKKISRQQNSSSGILRHLLRGFRKDSTLIPSDPLFRIMVEQTSTKIEVAFPSASVGMCDPWIINGNLISICWSVERWAGIRGTEFGYEVTLIGKLVIGGETSK